ncbi:MAG: DUF3604 domain-containing protein [Planctomycetes bacterium]|nr:DUF3604 domain-containing protein [Planctomycetota bacterium]
MKEELLKTARNLACVIGRRIHLVIPSILAGGETFMARVAVTGADAMPMDYFPNVFYFEGCVGVEGLPAKFRLDPGKFAGEVGPLKAVGCEAGTAVIRARIETPDVPDVSAVVSSNPAWVFKNPAYRLFWGDIHVHTKYSNCSPWRCQDPQWCYQYAQEVSMLDFVAPADHLRGIASDKLRWPRLQELARQHNQPGKFVTFLAFESSHAQGFGGDNNVYYLDDDAPYFWVDRDDMRGIAPKVHVRDLWRQTDMSGKAYFTVPHHTGRAAKYRSWDEDYYDSAREPLFEIYSSWGSSEMRHSRLPMSGGNNDAPSYFVDALKAGARFGVIASSDDHATLPGSVFHFRVDPFGVSMLNGFAHKGLAAVRSPELTRKSLFESMRRRNVYATTHARSLVDLRIGDANMGQEMPADRSLRAKREVRVRFTPENAASAKVILMRNGEPLDSKSLRGPNLAAEVNEAVFEDADDLGKIAIRGAKFHPEPFVVYYARIEDSNGAHQWTSPIWIDED